MYQLDPRSVWRHLAAERARYEKTRHPKAGLAAAAVSARLLCQSKLRTFDTVYRLALAEGGVATADRRRTEPAPGPYTSAGSELRLTTSQAGLAVSCGCDVRTLQRHLNDLQALGLVKVRQQLGLNRFGSPSFQLVLHADFLDWFVLAPAAGQLPPRRDTRSGPPRHRHGPRAAARCHGANGRAAKNSVPRSSNNLVGRCRLSPPLWASSTTFCGHYKRPSIS